MVCFRFRSLRTGTAVKILSFSVLLWVIDFLLTAHLESQLASIEAEVTEQYDIEKASENSAGITSHEIKRLQDELRTINGHIDDRRLVNAVQVKTSKWMGTEDVPVSKSALGVYNNAYVQSFKKNHVVTSGLCTSRPISGNTLPKFIFVAGVEGSGHHALKDVWWALEASGLKLKLIVYDQIFHSLGIENHASFHYSSISKETYQEHMAPTFSQAAADGAIVIDAQNSYPMGMGAGSLAHPDLVMLSELDGKLFDLRVIVIYRDPVAATLSAVRRFQDSDEYMYKNYEFQARMVSESLATINNALSQLPCGKYMVLEYEELVANAESFAKPIAQIIGVESAVLEKGAFKNLAPRPSKEVTAEVANKKRELEDFFSIQRKVLWPHL